MTIRCVHRKLRRHRCEEPDLTGHLLNPSTLPHATEVRMAIWSYKFVTSERFKNGLWYAISVDDKQIDPRLMHEYLNEVGRQGWELVTVVPVGETAMMRDQLLKHIFKRKGSKS